MEDSMNKISLVIKDILAKKELNNLNEDFVFEKVNLFLEKHKEIKKKLMQAEYSKFKRSREHEEIIKKIRAELREVYGVFIQEDYKKRFKLLEELKMNPSLKNHNKILALHRSSLERLPYYPVVYKKIFEITGMPKKIVDFACGLNPFSYPYLGCKPEYVTCDLAEKDLEFIQEYFRTTGIKGAIKRIDLIKDDVSEITKGADLVLLFKTLDSLEAVKWGNSETLLSKIKSKFIVVSFSTKSLGGKKTIKKEKRAWFDRLTKKFGYKIQSFEIPGELFYILS
jgi:16S rRNA (guanine(1405)-N(7))-methyltransferase